jgi:putative FmdB family regulatory protein
MPTYDYECQKCNHAFEHSQGMSDKKLVTCPECKKKSLVRLVGGGAGVVFKGFWPGKRVKEVNARKRRQASRLDDKVKSGEMTTADVDKMAAIRDKYASGSPYLMDPGKDGKQDPTPDDPSAGHFHHEQEV